MKTDYVARVGAAILVQAEGSEADTEFMLATLNGTLSETERLRVLAGAASAVHVLPERVR